MSTNHSDDSTGTDSYLACWSVAMRNHDFTTALSILDEGLQAATRENNTDGISFYTNLKKYTHEISKAFLSNEESSVVTVSCSMCGKGEADGCILVAGGKIIICDGCIKICLGVLDRQRLALGREIECSFCGKKQFEVSKIIAGPGVSICNNCVNICNEILARDSD